MRIAVLMGGTSAERDVSLATGLRVAQALRERGHHVNAIDTVHGPLTDDNQASLVRSGVMRPLPPDPAALRALGSSTLWRTIERLASADRPDIVFLALHGGAGEDGTVQSLLDLAGIPYTGSGHLASALAMDKDLSKRLFRDWGVPTPPWMMLRAGQPVDWRAPSFGATAGHLGLPLIVKPSKQGSTVGLSLVKDRDGLVPAIALAFEHDDEVMLETFVPGRELTVGVLGDTPLPVGEILPKHELYDYECKYTPGMATEVFPANLTTTETSAIQTLAMRAFAALKLEGYARIDFRMARDGEFQCLEANTLPGMTDLSLIPQAAAAAGMSFGALCERIVDLAQTRHATKEF
jgi:D-alanine-D-alanine ligase